MMAVLVLGFVGVSIGVWVWALHDVARYETAVWRELGRSQADTRALISLSGLYGVIYYLVRVRPHIRRVVLRRASMTQRRPRPLRATRQDRGSAG